jgi:AcrR family transcriptional regulator
MTLREQKKRQAREDILTAARELIDSVGFDAARMRDIASAANVSYQTLYNYFPTKTQIVQGILQQDLSHYADQLHSDEYRYRGDLRASLLKLAQLSLSMITEENRDLWRIATLNLLGGDSEVLGLATWISTNSLEALQLLLSRAQEFGELSRDAPASLIADTLYVLVDYMVLRYLIDPDTTEQAVIRLLEDQIALIITPHLQSPP